MKPLPAYDKIASGQTMRPELGHHIGISAVSRLEKPPLSTTDQFLDLLRQYQREYPGEPVVIAHLVRQVPNRVTKERGRQIYSELTEKYGDLPPKQTQTGQRRQTILLDQQVLELTRQGVSGIEASRLLGKSLRRVYRSRSRLIEIGAIKSERKIRSARYAENKEKVRELRKQRLGNAEISKRTGLSITWATIILADLFKENPSLRLRKRK